MEEFARVTIDFGAESHQDGLMTPQIAVPSEVLETPSLRLERVSKTVAPLIWAEIQADRKRLEEFLPWVEFVHSLEETRDFVWRNDKAWKNKEAFAYAVFEKSSGAFVGEVCVCEVVEMHARGELDYWLIKRFERMGYATEALRALVEELFKMGFHRLEISCAAENSRSLKVPARLGFAFEGTLRDHYLCGGSYHDELVFARLAQAEASR
jgi:ribosomal-protein-serine acetyltransferase